MPGSARGESAIDGYGDIYRAFDSPLMQRVRLEAYGEDIGQHSWTGAGEVRADIERLGLSPSSRVIDLGCGACGPLTLMLSTVGCRGVGVERSAAAPRLGRARAASLGVGRLLSVLEGDLNSPLPFLPDSFDAAMSIDVVLHLGDRATLFCEVARVVAPGGRFLFTDAGVLTGAVSNDEVHRRSLHGLTQFVAPGWNEALLDAAGFNLLETENRTPGLAETAGNRLAAFRTHRAALEHVSSADDLDRQEVYFETVVALARRGAVSRFMFLAERRKVSA